MINLSAQGTFFQNSTGLTNATRTVTFSEFMPPPFTLITTQYLAYGVSFFPVVYYAPTFQQQFGTPNIDPTASAGNFVQVIGALPQFSIVFQHPVTAAAFAVLSQNGTFDVTPLLNGVELAAGSHTFIGGLGPSAIDNFVGLSGVEFDELRIDNVWTFDHAMVFDNIQFIPSPTPPGLLSHFTFDIDGRDALGHSPPMELHGVALTDGALSIPFWPQPDESGQFDASASVPGLSYDSFTVALEFNPCALDYGHSTILSGGKYTRWFGLEVDATRHLEITLNNTEEIHPFTTAVATNRWHTLVCSIDVTAQKIVTFLDGEHLPDVALQDFQFKVVGWDVEESEKGLSFMNGGNGAFFCGLADNLRVFNRALSADEIESLGLSPRIDTPPDTNAPAIYHQPRNVVVRRGDTAVFSLDARSAEPLDYYWFHNGRLIRGAASPELSVPTIHHCAAGFYTVVASNALGKVESDVVSLAILRPVRIARQPVHRRAVEGQTVTLRVRATGSGPLSYQWFKGIEPLPNQTGPVLKLATTAETESSYYQVQISNPVSFEYSKAAYVEVLPRGHTSPSL